VTVVYIGKDGISVDVFRHYDGGLGGPMLTLEMLVINDGEICDYLNMVWRSDARHGHRIMERPL
jgi:hypothetical protein